MPTELTKTEQNLNELCWSCSKDYGHLYHSFELALKDKNALPQLRDRDRFLLQQTQQRLPYIEDDQAVHALITHAFHMNTYEGTLACLELLSGKFNGEVALAEAKTSLEDHYGNVWRQELGFNPIAPEEYAVGASIPDDRPLPTVSN